MIIILIGFFQKHPKSVKTSSKPLNMMNILYTIRNYLILYEVIGG